MAGNGDIQTNRATYDKVLTLLKVGGAVGVVAGLLVAAILAWR
ncbi:hypothetical protein [Sphingomonas sp.]|nr:hypothetical protein [Sphingomonas sp.]